MRDAALRPNYRNPYSVKEWFDLWRTRTSASAAVKGLVALLHAIGRLNALPRSSLLARLANFVGDVRVQVGHLPLINPVERDAVGQSLSA
jgi:hypothetical protein